MDPGGSPSNDRCLIYQLSQLLDAQGVRREEDAAEGERGGGGNGEERVEGDERGRRIIREGVEVRLWSLWDDLAARLGGGGPLWKRFLIDGGLY